MPKLRPITIEELDDGLQYDEETHQIYWKNKLIQTETVVVLSPSQDLWAKFVGGAAVAGAVISFVALIFSILSTRYAYGSREYSGLSALYAKKSYEYSISAPEKSAPLNEESQNLLKEITEKLDALNSKITSINITEIEKFQVDEKDSYKICGPLAKVCAWIHGWW